MDSSVSAAFQDAHGFGDVPDKGDNNLAAEMWSTNHIRAEIFGQERQLTAGIKTTISRSAEEIRGFAASDPLRPARMMILRTDPARRPSFDLHIPGGETYFGGWFSILTLDDAGTRNEHFKSSKSQNAAAFFQK